MRKGLTVFTLVILLLLTVTCEEDPHGLCVACCVGKTWVCERDVLESTCSDWKKNKKDGYDWLFSEGVLCPPDKP